MLFNIQKNSWYVRLTLAWFVLLIGCADPSSEALHQIKPGDLPESKVAATQADFASTKIVYWYLPGVNSESAHLKEIPITLDPQKAFTLKSAMLNLGLKQGEVWMRLDPRLYAASQARRWICIKNPRLWKVDFLEYEKVNDQFKFVKKTSLGSQMKFSSRSIQSPWVYYQPIFVKSSGHVVFIRIWSKTTIHVPISIVAAEQVESNNMQTIVLYTMLGSFLLTMIAYNLLLYFSTNDKNHLFYTLLLICALMFMGSYTGFTYQYLLANYPVWNYKSMSISGILFLITVSFFSKYFLDTKNSLPFVNIILKALAGVLMLTLLFVLIGLIRVSVILATLSSLILAVVMVYASIYLWKYKNFKPARTYLISWIALYLAMIVHGSIQFGFFSNVWLLNYTFVPGIVISVLILSMGMAARVNELEKSKAILTTQLSVAKNIQSSLMPPLYFENDQLRIASLYKPMDAVGGDLIDVHISKSNTVLFTIADVTGHGIPAALISLMVKTSLKDVHDVMHDPGLAVNYLHNSIRDKLGTHHISVCFVYVDLKTGILTHSSAGHPAPVILRQSQKLEISNAEGVLLHPLIEPSSTVFKTTLESGDKVLLYTDGVVETQDSHFKIYTEKRLYDLIAANHHLKLTDLLEKIDADTRKFSRNRPLDDDFTMLAFEFKKI